MLDGPVSFGKVPHKYTPKEINAMEKRAEERAKTGETGGVKYSITGKGTAVDVPKLSPAAASNLTPYGGSEKDARAALRDLGNAVRLPHGVIIEVTLKIGSNGKPTSVSVREGAIEGEKQLSKADLKEILGKYAQAAAKMKFPPGAFKEISGPIYRP